MVAVHAEYTTGPRTTLEPQPEARLQDGVSRSGHGVVVVNPKLYARLAEGHVDGSPETVGGSVSVGD